MQFLTLALTASAGLLSAVSAQCTESNGNYYCSQVNGIAYSNFGGSGSYQRVTNMDESSGQCSFSAQGFSGSLAPFNEDLSIHLRGPINLKQFAFYTPSSSSSKRDAHIHGHRRHAHGHHGHGKPSAAATSFATSISRDPSEATHSAPSHHHEKRQTTSWSRQSYYDSSSSTAEGVTFLNTMGGSASGTFSTTFGSSLSYASSDGCSAASSAQTLSDTTLPSGNELAIFSGSNCSANNAECGYFRPGTVAYRGFSGSSKIFLFEFGMPPSGGSNMPALWFLNALVPRTQQYGDCSCWGNTDGCGEFDVFEALTAGEERLISSIHSTFAGGCSDYFTRPTSGTVKAAVVMDGDATVINMLSDDFEFGNELGEDEYGTLVEIGGSSSNVTLS